MEPTNLHDFEAVARARLPANAYAYFAGGAGDEVTLRANRAAFERIALRPRVLVDVSSRTTRTHVLDADLATPVIVAPMAFQRLAHADGELATARAVRAAGSAMILSTFATSAVEDVVRAAAPSAVWFQLYVFKDRGATKALVERAAAAGCTALVLTVDAPLLGRRERPGGTHIELTGGVRAENLVGLGLVEPPGGGFSLPGHFLGQLDQSLDWDDVAWLRGLSTMPVLVKGVLRGDDARSAVDAGCAGVIVSNHGGRQLDGAVASIDALPDVVDAVGGRVDVLVDGGVRRGVDVVRALALGARAVLLGRPILWGLATDGERGAKRVLDLLADEIDLAMALCGCRNVGEITSDLVGRG